MSEHEKLGWCERDDIEQCQCGGTPRWLPIPGADLVECPDCGRRSSCRNLHILTSIDTWNRDRQASRLLEEVAEHLEEHGGDRLPSLDFVERVAAWHEGER